MKGTTGSIVECLLLVLGLTSAQDSVRLIDGPTSSSGRIEVYYGGVWGTVCDDGFGANEALFFCRLLGFTGVISYGSGEYPSNTWQIWLDGVDCNGYESSIDECSHNGWGNHDCSHSEDVNLFCNNGSATGVTARLADSSETSSNLSAGALEVLLSDGWRYTCASDTNFDDQICQYLGFYGAFDLSEDAWYDHYHPSTTASSMEPVSIDCSGYAMFDDCLAAMYTTPTLGYCDQYDAYNLRCLSSYGHFNISQEGKEIRVDRDGQVGGICHNGMIGQAVVDVVCRELGFDSGHEVWNYISPGYQKMVLNDVQCRGDESTLSQCYYSVFDIADSSQNEQRGCYYKMELDCFDSSNKIWIPIVAAIGGLIVLVVFVSGCYFACKSNKPSNSKSTRAAQRAGAPRPANANSRTIPAVSSSAKTQSIGPQPGSQYVSTTATGTATQNQYPLSTLYPANGNSAQGTDYPPCNLAPVIGYNQGGQINHGYAPSPSGQPYPQMPKTPAGPPPGRLTPFTHTQQTPNSNGMTPVGDTGEIGDLPPPPSYSQLYSTNAPHCPQGP